MLFINELYNCSSAIHDMTSNNKHSFISSTNCHHPACISCKITESWKLRSVVSPPLANVATPLSCKPSVALNFLLMSLSHALGQHSVARKKTILSRARPAPSSTRARAFTKKTKTAELTFTISETQLSSGFGQRARHRMIRSREEVSC